MGADGEENGPRGSALQRPLLGPCVSTAEQKFSSFELFSLSFVDVAQPEPQHNCRVKTTCQVFQHHQKPEAENLAHSPGTLHPERRDNADG